MGYQTQAKRRYRHRCNRPDRGRKATQRAAALSRERVRVNEFSWFVRHEFGPIFAAQLRAWHIRHGFPLGVGAGAEQLNTLLDTAVNNFKKRTLGVLLSSAAIF